MTSPRCLTLACWRGFWVAFKASFGVAYPGGTPEQGADAAMLATYRMMRQRDPDLTWHAFWVMTHPNEGGK